jgi:CheY-like chemotaxis protein
VAGGVAPAAWGGYPPQRRVPRPRVILLDLNMPRMNGFEFLQALRADEALTDDIVFVLTTSDADTDRSRAYRQHVAGYMVKAEVGPQFSRLAQLLMDYQAGVRWP